MRFFPDCTDLLISLGYKGKLTNFSEIIDWIRTVKSVNIWIEHGHTGKIDKKIRHDVTIGGMGCLKGGYMTYENAQKSGIIIWCSKILKEKKWNIKSLQVHQRVD